MSRWEKRKAKWPWRDYLTPEERDLMARAEKAKQEWLTLNKERAAITNRAIQRAKYHASDCPKNADKLLTEHPEVLGGNASSVELARSQDNTPAMTTVSQNGFRLGKITLPPTGEKDKL